MKSNIAFLCCAVFSGCGGAKLKDGVFAGKSSADDTGAWGEISITVERGNDKKWWNSKPPS